MTSPRPLWAAALLLSASAPWAATVIACAPRRAQPASDGPAATTPGQAPPGDRAFHEGTAHQRELVAGQLARLASDDGGERLAAARRLGTLGEPAVAALIGALSGHPVPRVRAMSAWTLGFLDDRRAIEPLARALAQGDAELRLESAAALVRLGDDRGAQVLIQALEDPDPRVRLHAIGVLRDALDDDLGYEVDGDPVERAAAVARWRGWLARRRDEAP